MDERWKLGTISSEEDGSVVTDHIPVALFRVKLDREASRVASSVGRPLLTSNSGEASGALGLLADLAEKISRADVGDVVSDFKLAKGTSPFGVDDTLGNPFSVKVCE